MTDWSYPEIDTGGVDPYKAKLAQGGVIKPQKAPAPRAAPNAPNYLPPGMLGTPYGLAGLRNECNELRIMPPGSGRNDKLNVACFSIRQLVDGGELDGAYAWDEIRQAAEECGLTDREIGLTMNSGWGSAPRVAGARTAPERDDIPAAYQLGDDDTPGQQQAAGGEGAADDGNPYDAPALDPYERMVTHQALQMRISEDARNRLRAERAAELGQERPPLVRLDEFLAVPDEPAIYRINDNLPIGGNVLLAAQHKAGKSSLIANVIRALVDDEQYLDKWACKPLDELVLIDNELDERMLRRWLREQDIEHTEKVRVICMKGRLTTFNLLDDHTRAEWAKELSGADLIVLDPLRPVLDSLGLSEDKEAGIFLQAWDALKKEAGVDESIVVHHMGHSADRARGDSRLLDWADVNWRIRKESQKIEAAAPPPASDDEFLPLAKIDDGGQRFYTAHGRDVFVPEGLLGWDGVTRRVWYIGGEDVPAPVDKTHETMLSVVTAYTPSGGINHNALVKSLMEEGISRNRALKVIQKAENNGEFTVTPGANKSKWYQVVPAGTTDGTTE